MTDDSARRDILAIGNELAIYRGLLSDYDRAARRRYLYRPEVTRREYLRTIVSMLERARETRREYLRRIAG